LLKRAAAVAAFWKYDGRFTFFRLIKFHQSIGYENNDIAGHTLSCSLAIERTLEELMRAMLMDDYILYELKQVKKQKHRLRQYPH
jgi:hypothetical protein